MRFIDTHVAVWLYADKALVPDDVLPFVTRDGIVREHCRLARWSAADAHGAGQSGITLR